MSQHSILTVSVHRFGGSAGLGGALEEQDLLAVEEPLQISAGGRPIALTMRTPGHDAELAAGFLFTEGLVHQTPDVTEIQCAHNTAEVVLQPGTEIHLEGAERNFYISSSCGVCGKASIDSLKAAGCTMLPRDPWTICETTLRGLPNKLREAQTVFDRTGGLHASGLFTPDGEMTMLREDVGRHNAVDKLIGRAFLDGRLPLRNHVLLVSGRTSFELLQKAVMAGIPVLAAVGAPSSLAVKTARRFGLTLIGFLREDRFNVYSEPSRIGRASQGSANA